MRDAKVQLPMSIPKAHFVADMDYYGLNYHESHTTPCVADPSDLFHSLGSCKEFLETESTDVDRSLKAVVAEKVAMEMAKECFNQFVHGKPKKNELSSQ